MRTKGDVIVKLNETTPESTEVIADAIIRVSRAAAAIQASGLNRRALIVLLKDQTSVPQYEITKILDALPELEAKYTIKKPKKK